MATFMHIVCVSKAFRQTVGHGTFAKTTKHKTKCVFCGSIAKHWHSHLDHIALMGGCDFRVVFYRTSMDNNDFGLMRGS